MNLIFLINYIKKFQQFMFINKTIKEICLVIMQMGRTKLLMEIENMNNAVSNIKRIYVHVQIYILMLTYPNRQN